MAEELHERCGVVGVSYEDPSQSAALAARTLLSRLQHRGTDAAGIASSGNDLPLYERQSYGLVSGVFPDGKMSLLPGSVAIGHVQYPTDKSLSAQIDAHPQPATDPHIRLALAHNGTLPVTTRLRDVIENTGIEPRYHNDSQLAMLALATIIRSGPRRLRDGIRDIFPRMQGAFSCTAMQAGELIAFRDAYGIRPLEYGHIRGGLVFASETCAFEDDVEHLGSVEPGEMIVVKEGKEVARERLAEPKPHIDAFEFVYFASPVSTIAGRYVDEARTQLGVELASMYQPAETQRDNTVVVPAPTTSYPIASGYANTLRLPLVHAIHKDPFTTRTFIMPSEGQRQSALNRKHMIIRPRVEDKDVIVVDDSLVRGNTARVLVGKLRRAGAASVTLLLGSPPIRYPDFYGINIATQDELPAANMTVMELQEQIGCDRLGFLPVSALVRAIGLPRDQLNLSAFTGEYPIDIGQVNRNAIHQPIDTSYID